jgi:hypothetical protein
LDYLDQPIGLEILDATEIAHHIHVNQINDASQQAVLILMENRRLDVFGSRPARVLTNLFGWEIFE